VTEGTREEPRPEPIGTPVTEPEGLARAKGECEPLRTETTSVRRDAGLDVARHALAAIPVGFGPLAFALGALGLFGAAALWALRAPGVFELQTPLPAIAGYALAGAGWSVVGLGLARRTAWARPAAALVGVLVIALVLLGLPLADPWLGAGVLALALPWLREAREADGSERAPSAAYLAATSWGVLAVLVLALWPELEKAATVLLFDRLPPRTRVPVQGLLLALAGPAAVVLPSPLASARSRRATVAAHVVGAAVVLALLVAIVRGVPA
jgi:hypothetical protein